VLAALVALGAAILGAIAGGFLRERGDREALLRDRRIAAADDFLTTANEVFVALTEAVEQNPAPGNPAEAAAWLENMDEATAGARANTHKVTRRVARIELLFQRGSPTSIAAVDITTALLRMTELLRERPADVEGFSTLYEDAVDRMGTFTDRAGAVITTGRWWERGPLRPAIPDAPPEWSSPPPLELTMRLVNRLLEVEQRPALPATRAARREFTDPSGGSIEGASNEAIAEAIAQLPEREKLVMTLYYYEELTQAEIAEVLGVSRSTVSVLLSRAIRRLRTHLAGPTDPNAPS
jgi:RNA polymerase sigma factor (sigma-70 family)